jgi:hypothetical protein
VGKVKSESLGVFPKLDRAIALTATKFLFIKSPASILSNIGRFEIYSHWPSPRTPGTLSGECDRLSVRITREPQDFTGEKSTAEIGVTGSGYNSLLLNVNRKK